MFDANVVRGKQAPAVKGDLSLNAALQLLLADSGLKFSVGQTGLIIVRPAGEAAADVSPPAPKGPALEEVVVTADRKNSFSADLVQAGSFRGARALDTPLTVSVIPNEVLVSQQATQLLDALRNTAGVNQAQTSTVVYNNLAIRGITVDNRANYRLDGDLPMINLVDMPIEDKDRVEALKGASALYYGFTTPSGIINLTMKRPTATQYLETTVFGNNYGAGGGHIDYGNTWGKVGARINLLYGSVNSGIQYTAGTRSLASGAFDFKPTERLTISFDAEYYAKHLNEPAVYRFTTAPTATLTNFYPSITLPALLNPTSNFGPNWALNDAHEANLLAIANYKISDAWNFEMDAGRSEAARYRHNNQLNLTNAVTGDGLLSISLQTTKLLNQNLRAQITGAFDTGPLTHEVMFGFSDVLRDQNQPGSIIANCQGGTATTAPAACAENASSPKNFPITPYPTVTADTTRIADLGVYGFDRVKYGDWLQLLGGVRYSNYRESDNTTNVTTYAAHPVAYSVGMVIKPRPWVSFYGTYVQGLESTPNAPTTVVNAGAQLAPTTSTQIEGGIKLEPHKGVLFQAAYFDINRESTYTNSANVYVEDGRLEYRGVEASLTGEVTRDLSIYASGLVLDAEQVSGAPTIYTYSNGTTSTAYNSALVFKSVTPTLIGKFVEDTPRLTLSLSSEYRVPQIHGLSLTGGVYYLGSRYINPQNEAQIPGYTLVDLGGAYNAMIYQREVTFRINARNVGNVRYFSSTGGLIIAQGPPSEVRFAISTKF